MFNFLLQEPLTTKGDPMRILGFFVVLVSILYVIGASFFGLPNPTFLQRLIDPAGLIGVIGSVIGGCLIAYGSQLSLAFKVGSTREESITTVGIYKLAVRVSIGSGFIDALFGWIAMLGSMGDADIDRGALTGGLAGSLLAILYGLTFAFYLFLPLQYYFQSQLDKDS